MIPLLPELLCSLALLAPTPTTSADEGRVVILGFDGADGRTVEMLMNQGELPNLARLRDSGTFARLGTTAPAESPVSWACLNTGQNPAKTGVPGFVMNSGVYKGGSPLPGFGHVEQLKGSRGVPLEELRHNPYPNLSQPAAAGAGFGVVFVGFLGVFALLLRIRFVPSLVLSLLLGGVGGWGGWKLREYLPSTFPRWENPNQARNMWDYAADAGVESIVIDAAQAWDQEAPEGARVLAGLGLPDARWELGDWFVYTDNDLEWDPPPEGRTKGLTAGNVYRVYPKDGLVETKLYGPTNFVAEDKIRQRIKALDERLNSGAIGYKESREINDQKRELEAELKAARSDRLSVDMSVEFGDESVELTIDGQTQTLTVGGWSDWYKVQFQINPLIQINAITRCRLTSLEDPYFSLFVSRLDIDPSAPPFWQPISEPPGFAGELAKNGPYETYGWSTLTMPFKDDEVPVDLLLEDVEFTLGWRERITYEALERDDWRLLMSVFSTTDRVQHMCYQFWDEEHPLYDAAEANRTIPLFGKELAIKDAIVEIYRQMDRVVGKVVDEHLGPNDTLFICSDHGFQSFRRQVHINNWLVEKGYMVLADNAGEVSKDVAQYADWSRTRAYSLGLGFIYLNLKGREPNGIVDPSEADALLDQIRADLLLAEDPDNPGTRIATDAYFPKRMHTGGEHLAKEADLICGFAPTYRVSWRSSGGGIKLEDRDGQWVPTSICEDNDSPWSGGHVSVDRMEVRGVFFSNKKVQLPEGGPSLYHLAPTTLDLLGVDVPAEMDLGPLTLQ